MSATNRAKKALETIVRFEAAWGASVRDEFVMARLRAGLTQKEVADRAGVTQATIAEFETTRWPDPRLSTLRRYLLAVGCSYQIQILPTPASVGPETESEGQPHEHQHP